MKNTHPRMYHPFPTRRSKGHFVAFLIIVLVPLLFLSLFSYVSSIGLPSLLGNLSVSLFRIFFACIIASSLGWIFAVSFYNGKKSEVVLPIFDVLQSFPTSAALPIAALYFGSNGLVVIFFLSLQIIWSVFFSIIGSLRLIRRDWVEAVKISRIKRFNYLRKFLFPVTVPGLITGTIIGMGNAWESLVATEIIVNTKSGLGHFFNSFSSDPRITFFGILALLAIVFFINKIVWVPLLAWSHGLTEE